MIKTRTVDYHGDGVRMLGFLAIDAERQDLSPAVLVAPEAPGLDDFNRERCNLLAALGYAAFALDFHGDGTVLANPEQIGAHVKTFQADPVRTRARAQAALAALRAQPGVDGTRVAAIGYCFGGSIALELARSGADLKAVVGFHCGLRTLRPVMASTTPWSRSRSAPHSSKKWKQAA
jgi:dienelactone hydrolase